jgi:hypothetical protein
VVITGRSFALVRHDALTLRGRDGRRAGDSSTLDAHHVLLDAMCVVDVMVSCVGFLRRRGLFGPASASSSRKSRTQEKLWVRLLSAFDRKKSDPNFYASEFFQDRSGSVRLLSSPQRIAATPTDTSTEKTRTKKSRTDLPKSYI